MSAHQLEEKETMIETEDTHFNICHSKPPHIRRYCHPRNGVLIFFVADGIQLGCHVALCSRRCLRGEAGGLEDARKTEIREACFTVVVDEDIALYLIRDRDKYLVKILTPLRSPCMMDRLCKYDKAEATCVI